MQTVALENQNLLLFLPTKLQPNSKKFQEMNFVIKRDPKYNFELMV